jgi:hypothetical protein
MVCGWPPPRESGCVASTNPTGCSFSTNWALCVERESTIGSRVRTRDFRSGNRYKDTAAGWSFYRLSPELTRGVVDRVKLAS